MLPSVTVVLDEVRRRLDFQFELSSSHDFKASIILATSCVTVAILLTSLSFVQSQLACLLKMVGWIGMLGLVSVPVLVLVVSAVLSIVSLWVRNYDRPPRLDTLRNSYLNKAVHDTELQLIDIMIPAISNNELSLKRQTNLIRTATIFLMIGLTLFVALLFWLMFVFFNVSS